MAVSGAVLDRAELLEALTPRLPRVTALIGGGGKTTLLYALGAHLAARGGAVVLTTTTHLGYDPAAVAPAGPEELNRLLLPGRAVLAGYPDAAGRKLTGIPENWYGGLEADYILVEADGSRGLPLKYHRPFEPVVPAETGLLIELAGLTALDRPAGAVLHSWQEAGLSPGRRLDEPLAAELLERGLKVSHFTGRSLAVLNQADTPELAERGRRIWKLLTARGIEAWVARMKERELC